MEILLTDYHCASNRGDAAILEGELSALRDEFPDASFTVLTEYPDAAKAVHDIDAVAQRLVPFSATDLKKNGAITYMLLDAALRDTGLRSPLSRYIARRLDLQPYYDADLVVSTGGQYITDIYFPDKLAVLAELTLCNLLDKPVVLYAQSLGPFDSTRYRPLVRRVLDNVDLITTRDEPSVNHLQRLGVTGPPIHARADAAFSMPVDSPRVDAPIQRYAAEELDAFGNAEGPSVSISVREWSYFEGGSQKQYFDAVAETAEWLIRRHDAAIVFASTCTGLAGYHTDDRTAAQKVMSRMDASTLDSVSLLTGEYSPYRLVEIYGEMDLHIGTRMHSTILAILGGTAPVPVEYQFKTSGTMALFDLADHVLDIDGLTAQVLQDRVADSLADRTEIVEQIETKLPAVREQARQNSTLVREHVDLP